MKMTSREMQRIAGLIDRVVGDLDVQATDAALRQIVRAEATEVLGDIIARDTQGSRRLRASLERLVALMDTQAKGNGKVTTERHQLSIKTLLKAFAALTGGALLALPGVALAASVGDTVVNPTTGISMQVTEVVANGFVAKDSNENQYFVYTPPAVGSDAVVSVEYDANGNQTEVRSTILRYNVEGGGTTTSVTWVNGFPTDGNGKAITGVVYGTPASGSGQTATPEVIVGTVTVFENLGGGVDEHSTDVIPGAGDQNREAVIAKGKNGSNGRTGAIFVPASSGGAGQTGGTINQTISIPDNVVSASGNNAPGIIVASIGGNGGKGGSSYLNLAGGGKAGGRGGSGGNVNVTINGAGTVATAGNGSHGVVVQSRAGVGGDGGRGWASTGGGGAGGNAASGGNVIADIDKDITTHGDGSHGILVQSLGGGAGNSGSSYGLFGASNNGGWGGNGGNVEATSRGNITTHGDASHGVLAQSIGGTGGDAGAAGGIVAFGGGGGSGGNGGNVELTIASGTILTKGDGSFGAIAQSIGGSGGNAGRTSGIAALGSSGAEGGNAGRVEITTDAGSRIITEGAGSVGVVAQSIGGGGGNAGTSGGLVALGGSGSKGGSASGVDATINGSVATEGAGAHGVLAQSIGGGGGSGKGTGGLVALGGNGGGGGNAGSVDVTVGAAGSIKTEGEAARGIVAQSIGGGGGDAGNSGGLVALGGSGSGGGSGSWVSATNAGLIDTQGHGSDAILAQSIGGGGGAGGSTGGFVALGGSGAAGGNGASVTAGNSGQIFTDGDLSRGILAQSIGGGGGAAGSGGGVFSKGGSGGAGGNASVGGSSSVKSDGGAVTATNSGLIMTGGNMSSAIQAQSIGGGGGDGANANGVFMALGGNGGAGGAGGTVIVNNSGELHTQGADAHGIMAQSIGGGGGNGGATTASGILTAVAIGGKGSGGGHGGNVTINQSSNSASPGKISTQGDRSNGVMAQSIGGGGGNGGFAIANSVGVGASVSVALGGDGAGGGNGGTVNYTGYADINTGTYDPTTEDRGGHNSSGILLQSIGGGGGNGGFTIANSVTGLIGAAVSVGIGGNGGAGGTGGNITATNAGGDIITRGDFSSGLIAQTIGGGGGNGGYSIGASVMGGAGAAVTATIGGEGANGGRGGKINVDYTGDITTLGLGSTGVLLQSISGGGGNGGFSVAASVGGIAAPAISVGIGGNGGQGEAGNDVVGDIRGNIETYGDIASGFVAQSVGGGGGNGGYSVAGSVSGGIGGIGVSIGIGGNGGGGGAGGLVDAGVHGTIYTEGDLSTGFVAQSVGGGGGNGGFNVSGAVAGGLGAAAVSVGLGGNGGAGGAGGRVDAYAGDTIETKGIMSGGFVAQSIGGGGGNGGFNVSGSIAGGLGAGAINVGLGGSGDNGGHGGIVNASAHDILTHGLGSTGFLAQSVGGSGGAGGFNVSAGIAGGIGAGTINVGLGGNGAGGGNGGAVIADIDGTVQTLGDLASAIVVQSLGGGGGSGGYNVSAGIGGGVGSGSVNVSLGGNGAGGGNGGLVDFTQIGNALTEGLASKAVVLQSIGGGGGDGGFSVAGGIGGGVGTGTVSVALGGSGAGGGHGGNVFGHLTGDIQTLGALSTGILAQSVGGGGGSGGFSVAGGIAGGVGGGSVNVSLGGNGAGGGDGGLVDFTQIGNALTKGLASKAIVMQSIGGGGGDGGFSVAAGIAGGVGAGTVGVGLGGNGAGGGDGGTVIGNITGDIQTEGDLSTGVLAQSVGGGGGSGGFNVTGGIAGGLGSGTINVGLGGSGAGGGDGGNVTFDMIGNTLTTGDMASAIVLQSLGGGGGDGGFSVAGGIGGGLGTGSINVSLGGNAGVGGVGGDVTGDILGTIATTGEMSSGLVAQSIGGGGGSGGFSVAGGIAGAAYGAGAINVGLGGSGGGGGNAGAVDLDLTFAKVIDGLEVAILTEGAMSNGLLAQSIGGGGGAGGFSVVGGIAAAGYGSGTINVGIGGSGGAGGDADTVDVDVTGAVITKGDGSTGITAQSVGGGGGAGGFNVVGGVSASGYGSGSIGVALGGTGDHGGDAGNVFMNQTGGANANGISLAVLTEGRDATGILAQSIGGGGGSGGFNINGNVGAAGQGAGAVGVGLGGGGGEGGAAGTVSVDIAGLVKTMGDNSRGVVAQSIGGGGGDGGMNIAGSVGAAGKGAGAVTVGIGGYGAGGGDAKAVILKALGGLDAEGNMFAALTQGDNATAFTAQSIGGGGGTGGMSIAGSVSGAGKGAGSVTVGLGGAGGTGGHAGTVQADVSGYIGTEGDYSGGVLAQSVGGGGGAGGMNISAGVSGSGEGSGNVVVGIGGAGGAGGTSSAVSGVVRSDIYTEGYNSYGLTYQSIGGGGGSGGMNISAGVSVAKTGTGNAVFGMGGLGGDGGEAGTVDLDHVGSIFTSGDYSHGILAQSLGGGGGSGGLNVSGGMALSKENAGNLVVGIGGMGGGGGNAADVTGTLAGNITTQGDNAFGSLLQSLGGGGGAGGMNISGGVAASAGNGMAGSIVFGMGGLGGLGGDGANVTGTVTGNYLTEGANSFGVGAQSLGGGGGTGGMNVSGSIAVSQGNAASVALGVGGFGGGGGDAGDVSLTRIGDTQTEGADSDGVLIQSLGGGGGAGGMNVSGALSFTSKNTATSVSLGLGGFGGLGGDGGNVTGVVQGNVWAKGELNDFTDVLTNEDGSTHSMRRRDGGSNGIVAQSIGGGGGTGGLNVSAGIAAAPPQKGDTRALTAGVGGFGGGGGNAGTVDLTINSATGDRIQVQANGDNRSAVMAQSIGGGGGNGGLNVSGSLTLDGQLTAGIGGFGGKGGYSSTVDVNVDADLYAAGNLSRGLLAQSIGGGGGAGAINISGGIQIDSYTKEASVVFGLGGFGGAGGHSDDVTAALNGNVLVEGVDSVGALVQSIAGGGGSGGLNVSVGASIGDKKSFALSAGVGGSGGAGDDAGDVSFTSTGNVLVGGSIVTNAEGVAEFVAVEHTGGGGGVIAQSVGGGGGTGGINVTGALSYKGSPIALGVGGSGGSGGHGGAVSVVRGWNGTDAAPGVIQTYGNQTHGLVAQSIGGGGGTAGHNLVLGLKLSGEAEKGNEIGMLMAVGGSGAGAGSGDTVGVRHNGTIITDGNMSDGLIAQSIGGGGGNASFNIGLAVFNKANTAINMAVGGDTGAAGSGGAVDVEHRGDIFTKGDLSRGILAQSIGGGGGNVGTDMAIGIFANTSISATLGRKGGSGGEGGKVAVDVDGRIITQGNNSDAIIAQSIGGGGGTSGVIAASVSTKENGDKQSKGGGVSIGIEGGVAATSDDVTVTADGIIYTGGDDARGIVAQSIGGGGGIGGSASATLVFAGTGAWMSVGANGGEGAESGDVFVTNKGLIETAGAGSDGILAQAIGGGGGLGGSTRTIALQITGGKGESQNTMTFAIGGTGGEGALGGQVFVDNSGKILTAGEKAFGIRAQSIGGGGGIGGSSVAATLQGFDENNAVEINIGGSGGEGGAADLVDVTNTGLIYTKGAGAAGISANSIGGGGGDGGMVMSLTILASPKKESKRFVTNIGGSGGTGGTGGNVIVRNLAVAGEEFSGTILTEGDAAHGIMAQSIGGGGGNGSSVLSLQTGVVTKDSIIASFNLGGMGGSGNKAGRVDVENTGVIYTQGADAYGILAQSVGGGGGNGGLSIAANAIVNPKAGSAMGSVGGFGGSGGDGGRVYVNNSGTILTEGANAHGIVAQSIGGGGGNANFGLGRSTTASGLASTALSNTAAFALGNLGGGSGGIGGEVVVDHSGDITVLGDGAVAIKAESINGGGGSLAMDLAGVIGMPGVPYVSKIGIKPSEDPVIAVRIGAIKATSMNAGKVTVNTTGTFQTAGEHAVVDFAQSLSGGGGTLSMNVDLASIANEIGAVATGFHVVLGGMDGNDNRAADIANTHTGALAAFGDLSTGVLTQAIGGGGGRGVMTVTAADGAAMDTVRLDLGAAKSQNETGGAINRTQDGAVVTRGDLSFGSVLQSIGGGGGSMVVQLPSINTGLVATLGAQGGSGADASGITGTYSGGTQTFGDNALGLLLQSIGAGGGEIRLSGVNGADLTLGGSQGVWGDGGAISLTHNGGIFTSGNMAHGLMLQSIGGGGGAVFGAPDGALNLSGDNSGNGGAIRFVQSDAVVVTGDNSYGVVAQSLGGGGGWVDGRFAGSAGGAGTGSSINLDFAGIIYAAGLNSVGVLAQSEGLYGADDITINLADVVRGGSGTGVGIQLLGGADNLVTTNTSLSAVSGMAILGEAGNDRIVNNGLVFGNIDLSGGDNRFLNSAGATFLTFERIILRDSTLSRMATGAVSGQAVPAAGGEATFTNEGLLRLGLEGTAWPLDLAAGETFGDLDGLVEAKNNVYYGARVISTVELDGHFVQSTTGKSLFDVAFGPYASDRLNITGNASVSGEIGVNLLWLENAGPLTLFATGGEGSVGDYNIASTLALNYSLKGDSQGVHLIVDSDFGLARMRPNERRLGGHMDSALQEGGANGIGRLMAALGNMVSGQEDLYQSIFNELNPEGHVASMQTQYFGATAFADQMFGCGLTRETALDRCLWGVGSTSAIDQEATGEYFGATSRVFNARVGMEQRLNADWTLSVSGGYNSLARQTVDRGRMNTQGDGFDLGIGAHRSWAQGTDLRLTATGGWQWLESQRYGYVFDTMHAKSKGENGYAQLGAELGHTIRSGHFYMRPAVQVLGTALRSGAFEENGWQGLGARVLSDTQYIGSIEPKVTTGVNFDPAEGVNASFALTAGRVHRSEDGIYLPIQFIGAAESSDPAQITTPLDRAAWNLGFDARVQTDAGVTFEAGYEGQLGKVTDIHSAKVSVRWTF
ncbi:autotransporter outer membrane beta-barrel domain-containing protein [Brevundimonas sp.]|uniref:autotransporter outer membrane beta-barrel domain-containing protein n=1 Tax=Brevundimonas sp. TaxID=1871086 RepID=UPI00289A1837|nr:autotransporter outer membrane beta-barrel domain-containing protein [Brevundimonas sp.]